ncbi:relaxase/mobilization nuclease domain-containing protein [Aquincola sp. S2]|uniref:Relaxase/mobilization nuclease domain-containing protein n=1 Tax=Pseudaquabacterium terrae TaxID=2732868 RepID=A0ABX2ES11_9BURK|nr:LPD7 domain-containing protein [Aquabacterium terrae]NRF71393.1 relaxase/mobilization nuclease domain-containing protein [Aquabacterium terrae]
MSQQRDSDGVLVEWGTRLFYPRPKARGGDDQLTVKGYLAGRLAARPSANAIRQHVRAVVTSGGKQVMVKITGGGRGLSAIKAHMRYISRQGKDIAGGRGETLELENERGQQLQGQQAIKNLATDWRLAGSYIHDDSPRKEAFNIILSMPEGTPPEAVRAAAREFARETFEGHKYVFVLHTDTKSPHVHLAVRAERSDGIRLNPRKADLQRWRERFAARLQDQGINALATPARPRAVHRSWQTLWRERDPQRVRVPRSPVRRGPGQHRAMAAAHEAWGRVEGALRASARPEDQQLAIAVSDFIRDTFRGVDVMGAQPTTRTISREQQHGQTRGGRRPGLGRFERVYGAGQRRVGGRFAAPEPNIASAGPLAKAKTLDGLRELSGVPVVRFTRGSEVLLPGDASRELEHRDAQSPDALRRPGSGAAGGVADKGRVPLDGPTDRDIEAALRRARERFGDRLKLSGDDAFKERVAQIVARTGMDVRFTDDHLNARVDQLQKARGKPGHER